MAWSTPLTAVSNALLSAVQFNASIRDNLNATAPAVATVVGSHFTASGTNAVAQRTIVSSTVGVGENTSSTTYSDLATAGPSVTANCQAAIVFIQAMCRNIPGDGFASYASFSVSGATTISASDNWTMSVNGVMYNNPERFGIASYVALNAGSNTFTMKYRCQPAYTPARFEQREIAVIPL